MVATGTRSHYAMPLREGRTDVIRDESVGPLEDSGGTVSASEGEEEEVEEEEEEAGDDDDVDEAVADDMAQFEASFKNISQRYRLINRIGEGTFSTVYKAEDLLYDHYQNDWDLDADKENAGGISTAMKPATAVRGRAAAPHFVAIKKIYVTSSPLRILNELELLHDLRSSENVCPLITAFRHHDQVIAVLPFVAHDDFRDYYGDFTIDDIRFYMHSLFTAVRAVHDVGIIHRDIKPTNFLYSPRQHRGVLVDFGLAEREGTDYHHCVCCGDDAGRQRKVQSSVYATTMRAATAANQPAPRPSYPTTDQRPSRRANRAGTRGFRAPEVLLKCTAQTVLLDVWSCGVILLTFLSRRFPFFHSADDIDAFIELSCIFGKKRMKEAALLHGQVLHTNIPTISENGHSWEKVVLWCTDRTKKSSASSGGLTPAEREAVAFLNCCLELDPAQRISAEEALCHPFLASVGREDVPMWD